MDLAVEDSPESALAKNGTLTRARQAFECKLLASNDVLFQRRIRLKGSNPSGNVEAWLDWPPNFEPEPAAP